MITRSSKHLFSVSKSKWCCLFRKHAARWQITLQADVRIWFAINCFGITSVYSNRNNSHTHSMSIVSMGGNNFTSKLSGESSTFDSIVSPAHTHKISVVISWWLLIITYMYMHCQQTNLIQTTRCCVFTGEFRLRCCCCCCCRCCWLLLSRQFFFHSFAWSCLSHLNLNSINHFITKKEKLHLPCHTASACVLRVFYGNISYKGVSLDAFICALNSFIRLAADQLHNTFCISTCEITGLTMETWCYFFVANEIQRDSKIARRNGFDAFLLYDCHKWATYGMYVIRKSVFAQCKVCSGQCLWLCECVYVRRIQKLI